jgi:hypothetical protein
MNNDATYVKKCTVTIMSAQITTVMADRLRNACSVDSDETKKRKAGDERWRTKHTPPHVCGQAVRATRAEKKDWPAQN